MVYKEIIDKGTSPFLVGKYDNVNILPGYSEENIIINSAPNSKLRWEKTSILQFRNGFFRTQSSHQS